MKGVVAVVPRPLYRRLCVALSLESEQRSDPVGGRTDGLMFRTGAGRLKYARFTQPTAYPA